MFQNYFDITRAAALHFKMKYVGCHVVTEQRELDIAVDLQMQKGQKMHVCRTFTLVFWAFWREK